MQSELLELEQKLANLDREAATSSDYELEDLARRWEALVAPAPRCEENAKKRRRLIEEIDVKLDRYRKS
jgi:flagellar biosynthesis/type III secretory pathway chaperone